jgi:hypothetical protein
MDNYWKGCPPRMDDGRFLQDFRSPSRREQYIKHINGIVRDDDQRMFYQQNAEQIMDREWQILRRTQSCFTNACIHNYPTRTSPGSNYEELQMYNAVRKNKIMKEDKQYPHCKQMADYRLTHTGSAGY